MKIKKIRYDNFRNFEKKGEVSFDTTGKVTIIYGENGDGKTTFHQLFQWILYGKVSFNKTTSADKLYNLKKGKMLSLGSSLFVVGEIEFTHNNKNYTVRREWEYQKNKNGVIVHRPEGDSFYITRQNDNLDWIELDKPETIIEEILPSGLSPYFFFDGETMIADLKIRGTDSAKTLKKALYTIFELEMYEKALIDIGNKNKSQSVLGQLDNKRLNVLKNSTSEKVQRQYATDIKVLQGKLETINEDNDNFKNELKENKKRRDDISELIGASKSKGHLESARKLQINNINDRQKDILEYHKKFGKEITNNYAYLLISSVVKEADQRLYLQVQDEEKKIIPGLTKELLSYLIKSAKSQKCICGHTIGKEELLQLEEWRSYFPPASYKSTYDKFTRNANRYSRVYDEESLEKIIGQIYKCKTDIQNAEKVIISIDEELSQTPDNTDLLNERSNLEAREKELLKELEKNNELKGEFEHGIAMRDRKLRSSGKSNKEVEKYENRINLMESVVNRIGELLRDETIEYSQMLKDEIQSLVDIMLTSKREVSLTDDFQLQVKDSYGDESKSEGQFAVISFAYIGGILKVLKSHEKLAGKEYPLILDGPFSKLDEIQKRNVVNILPQFAPQMIIFSKDSLQDYFDTDNVGKIWTIVSNAEKNNAEIKEGFLW